MRGSTRSRSFRAFLLSSLLIPALIAAQAPAAEDGLAAWQPGDAHAMHWPQQPDFSANGLDVSLFQTVLADDFRCSASGPVQDIHLWASFQDNGPAEHGPGGLMVELSLYSDMPGDGKTVNSPGELLWTQTFSPGQYLVRQAYIGPERWYDPATGQYSANARGLTYQYSFHAEKPLAQQEGIVYWLGVRVQASNGSIAWRSTGQQRQWNGSAACLLPDEATWSPTSVPAGHPHAGQGLGLAFVITGADAAADHDLGDAPDSSNSFSTDAMPAYPNGTAGHFPTVYQAGSPPYGPLHLMPRDAFYLGPWVSLENEADLGPDEDAVNNLAPATGVANRDAADDGLGLPVVMPACQLATLEYTLTATSSPAGRIYVNLWCDWNRDGDWNDVIPCTDGTKVPEWAVQDHRPFLPELGTFALTTPAFRCWHPKSAGDPDPLWVRITVSDRPWSGDVAVGGSGPAGGYDYGETEDYYLQPLAEQTAVAYDWGDAPDAPGSPGSPGYPTLAIHDGARHTIAGPWSGGNLDRPDGETDGQPQAHALGDNGSGNDDENGVAIPPLVQGQPASITFQVSGGGGSIQGWIDFDGDQAWQDDEQVVDGFFPDGTHSVPFAVPQTAALGQTFARLRISRSGGLGPYGPAPDGEVEDHEVWIRPVPTDAKWYQWPDSTPGGVDVRANGDTVEPRVLADDFQCTSRDRLTLIRLWGSWRNDQQGQIKRIRVSIHPDDPTGPAGPDQANWFSQPGPETLWQKVFFTGQFEETLYHVARMGGQWWWDPNSGELLDGSDAKVWQIDLKVDPGEAFLQSGSPDNPQTLWLAVAVETTEGQFGWKTRQWPEHDLGGAVMDIGNDFPRPWQVLQYPQGHPRDDLETNSMDLAFCLTYTAEVPDQATSRPGSVTTCPAVETQCPATATRCPTMTTLCPAVETKCPAVVTQCPAVATQCPPGETSCPSTATHCPVVETRCPATATQCPAMSTMCPAVETKCPAGATQCPVVATHCPPSQTACPASATKCPTTATQCPTTATQCPTTTTLCPAVETKCPAGATQCPAFQTQCPPSSTACPTTVTQCPLVETKCPAVLTQCPATVTECSGACPSLAATTSAAGAPSTVPVACPVIETACPSVTEYLALAASR